MHDRIHQQTLGIDEDVPLLAIDLLAAGVVSDLRGGMSAKRSREVSETLEAVSDEEERVLVTTGRYLGEGFDDARLDTLFLTMLISWRGTLAQYVGRLHASKRDVITYDYVDENEPMLAKMATKRELGYRSLGYRAVSRVELDLRQRSSESA